MSQEEPIQSRKEQGNQGYTWWEQELTIIYLLKRFIPSLEVCSWIFFFSTIHNGEHKEAIKGIYTPMKGSIFIQEGLEFHFQQVSPHTITNWGEAMIRIIQMAMNLAFTIKHDMLVSTSQWKWKGKIQIKRRALLFLDEYPIRLKIMGEC